MTALWSLLVRLHGLALDFVFDRAFSLAELIGPALFRWFTEGKALTLRDFRLRLDVQPSMFDAEDEGACGCTS